MVVRWVRLIMEIVALTITSVVVHVLARSLIHVLVGVVVINVIASAAHGFAVFLVVVIIVTVVEASTSVCISRSVAVLIGEEHATTRRPLANALHNWFQLLLLWIVVTVEHLDQLGSLVILQFGNLVDHLFQTWALRLGPDTVQRLKIVSVLRP